MRTWLQRWRWLLGIGVGLITYGASGRQTVSFFYSDLPPYEYTDQQGQAAGIGITQVQSLFLTLGWQVQFHFDSVPRGERALEQAIDFTSVVAPTAAQRQQYLISKFPLYQIELGVLRTQQTPAVSQWADLLKQPYLVLRDTRFAYLQQEPFLGQLNARRYEVANTADALRLLNSGRFAYFLCYVSSQQGAPAPWLHVDVLGRYPVFLAVSRQHPQAAHYMQTIDDVLQRAASR